MEIETRSFQMQINDSKSKTKCGKAASRSKLETAPTAGTV
jgi:hypothetical protein